MRLSLLIALFFSLTPTLSLAEEIYKVGRRICDNFKRAEEWYHNHHESEAYTAIGMYGQCLVLKGIVTNDEAMKGQGLIILDRHTGDYGFNDVPSMFFLAEYRKTGGTFAPKTDEAAIDRAIRAYEKTLLFINIDSTYPNRYLASESILQMEIVSYERIPKLYGFKIKFGLTGSHNRYLNDSPSYTGDKSKLNFYLAQHRDPAILDPNYSDLPVIIDSINQMISSSEACLNLRYKALYHRQEIYNYYQKRCNIFKLSGQALLPLEHSRQDYLYNKSCAKDVLKCSEYMEVYNQMGNVIQDTIKQLKAIPNPWR